MSVSSGAQRPVRFPIGARAIVRATIAAHMLPPATGAALDEFASRTRALFGPRLSRLLLFGSHARGTANEDSDVDVLVALDDLTRDDATQITDIVGDILTDRDVLLSPLILSTARFEELKARERLIALEIERDGIPV
jgi:predicted nucleotidyltransferase